MSRPLVSVILSTFDQPRALTLSLIGYRRQSFKNFEVVLADDGSDEETAEIVERMKRDGAFPIRRVWQENKGFRRAKITNEAVKASQGRILLLSDGDCIPHHDFVKVHAEKCAPGHFCTGGWVRLSADYCKTLTEERVRAGEFEGQITPHHRWRSLVHHWKSRIGVLVGDMKKPKVYGCNISVDRDAFYAVNGLDENFDGFGKEDSDLRNRLRRSRAKPVSLWGRAWVYHVDDVIDPKIRRRRIPRKKTKEYYSRANVPIRCENGLVKNSTSCPS